MANCRLSLQKIETGELRKGGCGVYLGESFQTNMWLLKSASIEPRTSHLKLARSPPGAPALPPACGPPSSWRSPRGTVPSVVGLVFFLFRLLAASFAFDLARHSSRQRTELANSVQFSNVNNSNYCCVHTCPHKSSHWFFMYIHSYVHSSGNSPRVPQRKLSNRMNECIHSTTVHTFCTPSGNTKPWTRGPCQT